MTKQTSGHGGRRAVYVDNNVFRRRAYNSNHPLAIRRTETVFDLCSALGWLPPPALVTSTAASIDTLCRFHEREYVEALYQADANGKVSRDMRINYRFGTMENPLFDGVFERAATAVGGSILAARIALEGNLAFHPAGGTHHGMPGYAHGFCYFNDPVFALLTLLDAHLERLLYVDLDAHHGDGVEAAFVDEPRVSLLSIHERDRWPHTGSTNANERIRNLLVNEHCTNREFEQTFQAVALPFIETLKPNAVVITCGADSLAGDPLSSMALSNFTLWRAVEQIVDRVPVCVVLGGGGYNPWTLARCWVGLWARLAEFEFPVPLPPAAQRILRDLQCDLVDEDEIEPHWLSLLEDDVRASSVCTGHSQI